VEEEVVVAYGVTIPVCPHPVEEVEVVYVVMTAVCPHPVEEVGVDLSMMLTARLDLLLGHGVRQNSIAMTGEGHLRVASPPQGGPPLADCPPPS
jgi:hypothetical protein